jgi:hypothetical protein
VHFEYIPNIYDREKMVKNESWEKRRGAAAVERTFTVTQAFNGTRKLQEILADLLYAEYCRIEQKRVR